MKELLETCTQLGLDKVPQRANRLRISIGEMQHESVLFLICSHDFVFHASDAKFQGITAVFYQDGRTFSLNIGQECRSKYEATLNPPQVTASKEGTSGADLQGRPVSGAPVTFSRQTMRQQPGIRAGGVANYNLQTQALDVLVKEITNTDLVARLKQAFQRPVAEVPAAAATLDLMRVALRPYWGVHLAVLGL